MSKRTDDVDALVLGDIKLAEAIESCFCKKGECYLQPTDTLYLFHTRMMVGAVLGSATFAHSNQEFYSTRGDHFESLKEILATVLLPLSRGQSTIVDVHGDIAVKCRRWGEKRYQLTTKHKPRFW